MTASGIQGRRAEQLLASTLKGGIWSAAVVITAGLGLSFAGLHAPVGAQPAMQWPIVTAGLLLLILLPVARVMVMCILFLRARDYRFALVSASVLVIISLGFVVGLVTPGHAATSQPNHSIRSSPFPKVFREGVR